MLGKIGAMLGISSFASRIKHDEDVMNASGIETYQLHVTREEALKKRKVRKAQKAQKKARMANRRRK